MSSRPPHFQVVSPFFVVVVVAVCCLFVVVVWLQLFLSVHFAHAYGVLLASSFFFLE